MPMPGRSYNNNQYRYGHNGQEKDDEIFQGAYTAEYWEYDARIIRRWNVDPITIAWSSPYACFLNNPIYYKDPSGLTAEEGTGDGGGKGDGKTDPKYPLNKGGKGVELDEVGVSAKAPGFWSKVGNWFKKLGGNIKDGYVSAATKADNWIHKMGDRLVIWGTGHSQGPGKKAPLPKNPIMVDMSEILDYLGVVKPNHDNQVVIPYKWPTKGEGKGEDKANDNKGKLYEQDEEGEKPKLKVSNESTVQNSVNTSTNQVMGTPEPPVLIYYSLQTKDGVKAGTEQATQKNYKQIIKQMEAKGYTIDSVDRQLGK